MKRLAAGRSTHCILLALCSLMLLVGSMAVGADPELRAPLPQRDEDDPLNVASPVRIEWEGEGEMAVEIRQNHRVLFTTDGCHTSLVSGCEFHLDAGVYELTLREPEKQRSRFSPRPVTTWVRVRKTPETFDLRSQAAGTRTQMAALRSSLGKVQSRTSAMSAEIDKFSKRFETIDGALVLLLDQFALTDDRGEKPVRVEKPFQWLANRLKEIEAAPEKKEEE
jgi:hypothetical protein